MIILFFAMCVLPSFSQFVVGSGSMDDFETPGKDADAENLDLATIKVYYHFTQKKEDKNREIFRNDTMTLHIGPNISYYFDETKARKDSIGNAILTNLDVSKIQSISVLKNVDSYDEFFGERSEVNNLDGTSEKLYKNPREGIITQIDKTSHLFRCEDKVGAFDWQITADTATVLDYSCQKATVQFRGRNYEVWFAPELAINDGPWKFFGLPGLILKAEDSENRISFECIGLEYLEEPYQIEIPAGKYVNCNRKEYMKAMKEKSASMAYIINGGAVTIAAKPMESSCKPLELE